jgi:transglutaminase-like putative cysteine protease
MKVYYYSAATLELQEVLAGMSATFDNYLNPTAIIDSDHPRIVETARAAVEDAGEEPIAKAIRLYYCVRDGIWYDPYLPFDKPEHYRASSVLERRRAFCIGKATLLCALGRAAGIPARVGFADVRNHLATRQLREFMGSDVFVFHGYTEFYLQGRWVKATPAFNIELCRKHRVAPLEFNGREDSVFHPFNQDNKLFMEYVKDHGTFADIPVGRIVSACEQAYGEQRVRQWIQEYAVAAGKSSRDFEREEAVEH